MRKAQLYDVATGPKVLNQKAEVVKKSYVAPALTVDYASYFLQRNHKIEQLETQTKESHKQIQSLQKQEKSLQGQISHLKVMKKELVKSYEDSRRAGLAIYQALKAFSSKISIPTSLIEEVKEKGSSSSRNKSDVIEHPCGICDKTNDQHLLAKCDDCSKRYHLGCLDPPLLRMPKKSKQCGWVCSVCDHKKHRSITPSEPVIDLEAPRMLRQSIKEPDKLILPELKLYVERRRQENAERRKNNQRPLPGPSRSRKRPASRKPNISKDSAATGSPPKASGVTKDRKQRAQEEKDSTKESPTAASKAKRVKVQEMSYCKTCSEQCSVSTAVRCDHCNCWYHFKCFNPPVKRSPKHRGYQWFCDLCESLEDAAEGSSMEISKELETGDNKEVGTATSGIASKNVKEEKGEVINPAKKQTDEVSIKQEDDIKKSDSSGQAVK